MNRKKNDPLNKRTQHNTGNTHDKKPGVAKRIENNRESGQRPTSDNMKHHKKDRHNSPQRSYIDRDSYDFWNDKSEW